MKDLASTIKAALPAALPVMLGYVVIGLPCGILESQVGYAPWMALFLSATFYSGAGQFMACNMWLAGSPLASICASISFVNTRQILYSAAFSPYLEKASKRVSLFFAAFLTDESFGVNMDRFSNDASWSAEKGIAVNLFCMSAWALANFVGAFVGDALSLPTAIASYAMTAIFICLLATQKFDRTNVVVALAAMSGVVVCKLVGLDTAAILVGAVSGVVCGVASQSFAPGSRKMERGGAA